MNNIFFDKRPIGVFDSGVGGLTVLNELVKALPNENFVYLGDNENTPYGTKTKKELYNLLLKNLSCLKRYDVKVLVIACNTLSVNLIDEIKDEINIPIFGVYPPIEEVLHKKTLLLSTERTAEIYKNIKGVKVFSSNLAKDIENNIFNLSRINLGLYFNNVKGEKFDQIILGCTHYVFLENQIKKFFNTKVISGNKTTAKRVKRYLFTNNRFSKCKNSGVFFIGDSYMKNMFAYEKVLFDKINSKF